MTEKFVFLRSGQDYTLAINQAGKIFCFGKCPGLISSNPQSKDLQFFTPLDFTE